MIEAEITQDEDTDAIYIALQKGTDVVARTVEVVWADVLVDLDKDGFVIGIEILGIRQPLAMDGP